VKNLADLEKAQREYRDEERVRVMDEHQALADVRTLDEWALGAELRYWRNHRWCSPMCRCVLSDPAGLDDRVFHGQTPEAARAKAAAWVREQP